MIGGARTNNAKKKDRVLLFSKQSLSFFIH
jgi:hypothetical protein